MPEETGQPAPAKPAPAPAAPAKSLDEILTDPRVARSVEAVRDAVVEAKEFAGEITLLVKRERIADVCTRCKQDGYNYLFDLTGLDYSTYPNDKGPRFGVAYLLYSFDRNARVRLKVRLAENETVPTVSSVWKTANWHERETFDMFGIVFDGHPNLERILMWDGFNGHPLRKDFPVRGIDTGARIYPEVFPQGGGPMEGSTGKKPENVNLWPTDEPWTQFGYGPPPTLPDAQPAAPQLTGASDDSHHNNGKK